MSSIELVTMFRFVFDFSHPPVGTQQEIVGEVKIRNLEKLFSGSSTPQIFTMLQMQTSHLQAHCAILVQKITKKRNVASRPTNKGSQRLSLHLFLYFHEMLSTIQTHGSRTITNHRLKLKRNLTQPSSLSSRYLRHIELRCRFEKPET